MLQNQISSRNAFSLVELMLVVGIIGIVAQMAVFEYWRFTFKSHQAEAVLMINHINQLAEVYATENGREWFTDPAPPAGTCATTVFDTGATYCVLVDQNGAACNQQNTLGFYVADCTKNRYFYWYHGDGTLQSSLALSKAGITRHCNVPLKDAWVKRGCGYVCNYKRITDFTDPACPAVVDFGKNCPEICL